MADTLEPILADTQAHYRRALYGSWVHEHLRGRMLAGAIRPHAVGYAAAGWTNLVDHLRGRGHTDDAMVEAGVALRTSRGSVVDLLRDRLTIPVHGAEGQLVGFLGRCAPGADKGEDPAPKYLNTPATELFAKGATLYGLGEGADRLRAGAWPVLVEGPMDQWAVTAEANRSGLPVVAVATCGTALTERHLDALDKVTDRPLTLAYDGDPAGQAALVRAWELVAARHPDRAHRAIVLPAGQDPASIYASGRRALEQALMRPTPAAHAVADHRITPIADKLLDEPVRRAVFLAQLGATDMSRIPASSVPAYVSHLAGRLQVTPGEASEALIEGRFPRLQPTSERPMTSAHSVSAPRTAFAARTTSWRRPIPAHTLSR